MKVLDKEEKAIYDALMKDITKRKLHFASHKSCMGMKPPADFEKVIKRIIYFT